MSFLKLEIFIPETHHIKPLPLVILSHGLGSDHRIMEPYAESFAENGFAAYVFDYIGEPKFRREAFSRMTEAGKNAA